MQDHRTAVVEDNICYLPGHLALTVLPRESEFYIKKKKKIVDEVTRGFI